MSETRRGFAAGPAEVPSGCNKARPCRGPDSTCWLDWFLPMPDSLRRPRAMIACMLGFSPSLWRGADSDARTRFTRGAPARPSPLSRPTGPPSTPWHTWPSRPRRRRRRKWCYWRWRWRNHTRAAAGGCGRLHGGGRKMPGPILASPDPAPRQPCSHWLLAGYVIRGARHVHHRIFVSLSGLLAKG